MNRKLLLTAELIVLFAIVPVLYWFDMIPMHKVIPLIILFGYCFFILIIHKQIRKESFHVKANWKNILLRFFAISSLIILFVTWLSPHVFADLGRNKQLLLMLIIYPLSSAFPQELIFRKFFFHRYEGLFQNQTALLVVNIVLFSFAHIYYESLIVLAFTLGGGLLFVLTYRRTKSLLVVTIEHTLYGMLILSTSLSDYFYKAFEL